MTELYLVIIILVLGAVVFLVVKGIGFGIDFYFIYRHY